MSQHGGKWQNYTSYFQDEYLRIPHLPFSTFFLLFSHFPHPVSSNFIDPIDCFSTLFSIFFPHLKISCYWFCFTKTRPGGTAKEVEAHAQKAWRLEFEPWDPEKGRRELTLHSCVLDIHMCKIAHTYPHGNMGLNANL